MITEKQKDDLLAHIEAEKARLGTYNKVAVKCGISEGAISQIRSGTYPAESESVWHKIAKALNYSLHAEVWNIVNIDNTKTIVHYLQAAKTRSLAIGFSHKAGSSKTTSTRLYEQENSATGVFRLECMEWNRREFLIQLCRTLGISIERNHALSDQNEMVTEIAEFFNQRAAIKPLLILDEADKLKPAALRTLIPLYNLCESRLGLAICGTDNLEKEMKTGVRHQLKGYDELSSRFGRRFIHLPGATEGDVSKICTANGIADKKVHKLIFEECETVRGFVENQEVKVTHDLRRVRRIIERKLLEMGKTA
jgi:DNA transposition AAA+ family ATPase